MTEVTSTAVVKVLIRVKQIITMVAMLIRLVLVVILIRVRLGIILFMAMGCATWLVMCGNGPIVGLRLIRASAFCAGGAGTTMTITVRFRIGSTITPMVRLIVQGFESVVKFIWGLLLFWGFGIIFRISRVFCGDTLKGSKCPRRRL